jgi:hypothetical protein
MHVRYTLYGPRSAYRYTDDATPPPPPPPPTNNNREQGNLKISLFNNKLCGHLKAGRPPCKLTIDQGELSSPALC